MLMVGFCCWLHRVWWLELPLKPTKPQMQNPLYVKWILYTNVSSYTISYGYYALHSETQLLELGNQSDWCKQKQNPLKLVTPQRVMVC